jgi:hypothetical protein
MTMQVTVAAALAAYCAVGTRFVRAHWPQRAVA